jgi:hypothetical protein
VYSGVQRIASKGRRPLRHTNSTGATRVALRGPSRISPSLPEETKALNGAMRGSKRPETHKELVLAFANSGKFENARMKRNGIGQPSSNVRETHQFDSVIRGYVVALGSGGSIPLARR